ncbi:hypothetical protein E2C01_002749 [Portunus trituberculatus]|uniref:Uncharacterized protein n=1 Tax=Portunus trituberculatus TaxID=210409 RepID=A0A5B7CL44_PORTR|nr:hypothetical protein [Portunus trituberculatus]
MLKITIQKLAVAANNTSDLNVTLIPKLQARCCHFQLCGPSVTWLTSSSSSSRNINSSSSSSLSPPPSGRLLHHRLSTLSHDSATQHTYTVLRGVKIDR